jgi:cytochrome c oxidase subunit III
MAHAPAIPAEAPVDRGELVRPTVQAPPVTPGKVAMWLFLATEIMFFTGLIGSYIVLRAGSPPTAYSNLYAPGTPLEPLAEKRGVVLERTGSDPARVAEVIRGATGTSAEVAEELARETPMVIQADLPADQAEALARRLAAAGATAEVQELKAHKWPLPYDHLINPLSIDLTAVNTFILICSSVTMVLALAAIQRGDRRKLSAYLLATVLIGSVFLSIQVIEYYKLMFGDLHSVGISHTGHFRPSVSLFASCFFTMTGFHGAHVFGGVVMMTCIFIQSLRGAYTLTHHSPVELVGLYWHFVDLVWIILFTVVYLI